jgi:hypothetical protein
VFHILRRIVLKVKERTSYGKKTRRFSSMCKFQNFVMPPFKNTVRFGGLGRNIMFPLCGNLRKHKEILLAFL